MLSYWRLPVGGWRLGFSGILSVAFLTKFSLSGAKIVTKKTPL
jgi:hypothetical protein